MDVILMFYICGEILNPILNTHEEEYSIDCFITDFGSS